MEEVDRISDVPDLVIHYIFSFLEIKDVIQTAFLSKTWRHLWKSCPYLNFSTLRPDNPDKYQGFVDQVFHRRGNDFSIHKLSLLYHGPFFLYTDLVWVLSNDHLQELFLALDMYPSDGPSELPDQLFTSALANLTLFNYNLFDIQAPISMASSASIRSLSLKSVKLPNGNTEGELILCCSALEDLCIRECDHSHLKLLTISAVRLNRLELNCPSRERIGLCALKICSRTNIRSLKFVNFMYSDYCLENLSALTSAYIDMFQDMETTGEVFAEGLMKIFKGINNVRLLTLSASVLQGKIQRAADLPEVSLFSRLETIEVQNVYCDKDEIKFLEFLLEKATYLKTVIITSRTPDRMKLIEFYEKLLALPCASSEVSLQFNQEAKGLRHWKVFTQADTS